MGNQAGQPLPASASYAERDLQHFDHHFKAEIHTTSGPFITTTFGECKFAKRPVEVVCKGNSFEIIEDVGLTGRKNLEISYLHITNVSWDHGNSEVKIDVNRDSEENFVILTAANSVELEHELKLRFSATSSMNREFRHPSSMYIGMFAGATKPKPFQRKRPNISTLTSGKLPTLHEMRNLALQLHRGSYAPCPPGESRRMELAMQHIFEGCNTFELLSVRGISGVSNQWRHDSVLVINDENLTFKPFGSASSQAVEFAFEDIKDWNAIDNDHMNKSDSGIEIISNNGESMYFGVRHIRDVKHTLEYYWNQYQVQQGRPTKLGSTHGRPILTCTTLSGEVPAPEAIVGSAEVVDQDGLVVRPGGRMAQRRSSMTSGVMAQKEPTVVPHENRDVKKHWHRVVVHQGWLLKKGGVGIGAAKSWIKRYFVLYRTSQGHFLTYYGDFTECPMYSTERQQRNVVDLAKATFIRPGSNKADNVDTPPHSFDIVTTEREWTLCAESQENVQKWLKLLNRCIDEDVAILPDEDLVFKVKPKADPLGVLPAADYSTSLKVSANGIQVTAPEPQTGIEREHFFWVYTDFYKWSLLSQAGKLALLVNVFADSSFSRRNEFIFRTKDAVRLATAIEYFIEKFMSVMHVRLETMDSENKGADGAEGAPQGGLNINTEELYADQTQELDLLGLDGSQDVPQQTQSAHPAQSSSAFSSSDPFGGSSDPFADEAPPRAPPAVPAARASSDPFGDSSDPFGSSPAPPAPPAAAPAVMDLFDTPSSAPSSSSVSAADPFGFGGDLLGVSAASVNKVKTAPPLNPAQLAQHKAWFQSVLLSGTGPFYDDGVLQVLIKVEVRGSQGKISFQYRNNSPAQLNDLKMELVDSAGLLRSEMSPMSPTLAGLGSAGTFFMVECMKPASPGPELKISYSDTLSGVRSNLVRLPVLVSSFNEPLTLIGQDFSGRWTSLTAPGLEVQEVIRPSQPIVAKQIQAFLVQGLKFGRASGLPDESDFVLYGASSLRTGALGPNGDKMSIGCMVKIEINAQANALRVTVRAVHPAASAAMVNTVKALFA